MQTINKKQAETTTLTLTAAASAARRSEVMASCKLRAPATSILTVVCVSADDVARCSLAVVMICSCAVRRGSLLEADDRF